MNIHIKFVDRSLQRKHLKSKIDSTTWRREEKLERKLKMKDKKSKKSKLLKLMSSPMLELTKNICMNFKKKLFHSEALITYIIFSKLFQLKGVLGLALMTQLIGFQLAITHSTILFQGTSLREYP